MVIDTVLVKHVVTEVELTPWGIVFYNNILAFCLYPIAFVLTGEYKGPSGAEEEAGDGAAPVELNAESGCCVHPEFIDLVETFCVLSDVTTVCDFLLY